MIRITCPDCGTAYDVPDDVLQPEGRKVRCENCGHTWRAPPPEAAAREDRAHQLAEIRKIVDDVHQQASEQTSGTAPGREPETPARAPGANPFVPPGSNPPANPFAAGLAKQVDLAREEQRAANLQGSRRGDRIGDRIRDRIAEQAEKRTDNRTGGSADLPKRTARRGGAQGGGGFGGLATGFLLVTILAAALFSLYVFTPQIGARIPETGPVLENYRARVDEAAAAAHRAMETLANRVDALFPKDGTDAVIEN